MVRKRPTTIRKKLFTALSTLIIISAIFLWRQTSFVLDKTNPQIINFTVEKGESIQTIATNLHNLNLIKSPQFFQIYLKLKGDDKIIMAGNFALNTAMNLQQITKTLTKPPQQAEIRFTILEGVRIRDIDQNLSNLNLINPGEFINEAKNFNLYEQYPFIHKTNLQNPLEGYLYPDTYFINSQNFHPNQLIKKALDNFDQKTKNLNLSPQELHKTLTMASIVENEVFGYQDRQIVAGIFFKRLNNGWRLDADATLLYIMENRIITKKDLETDSPYNTRKNQGLPPGPISNPSSEAINATLNPKESPYWFYLTTLDTGKVIYAQTNEEHNLNRLQYL